MQNVCFLSENKKKTCKLQSLCVCLASQKVPPPHYEQYRRTSLNKYFHLFAVLHVFWNSSSIKITEAELRAGALGIFPRWTITRVRCQKNRLLGLTHIQAAKCHGLAWMAWLMVSHSKFCKMAWNSKTLQSGIHVSFCNIKRKAVEQACHFY